jgi:crotonobetainyl-CoA:carnitine CoA-transferase CaiB-like acyl-CoA transferase
MNRSAIEHAARLAGLELAPETDVTIEGADPVLASPLHLGEGAATAIALVGQEADRLWRMRGGRAQSLAIDVRHAAASLNTFTFVRVDGEAPGRPDRAGHRATGIWRCADGRFIFLHGSFTHTAGILAELSLDEAASPREVAAATRERGAFELEDALAAKGLCAAVCRTQDEWAAHEQGALLASKPVIEITKIGAAPPIPLPDGDRPLGGVRVLDLTRVLAGPTAARTLAEHGADVLHVASPDLPTVNLFEMDTGHGKRQAYLDLNDPSASATLRDLVRTADVFSQGFQLGSLARRGFGAEDLARLRPGIIYVSENAFGHEGPWCLRPGWEQLAQATSGVTALHAVDGRPALAPAAMNDYTTGYFAAAGAMMALRRRAVEGGSWLVMVSLTQTSTWYLRLGADLDRTATRGIGDEASITGERDTPYGRMRFLRPALRMSETPPRWELPSAPLGSGKAVWL